MKLENIMRVEILNLNFNIKDSIKSVSKTKKKNCWSLNIKDYIVHKLRNGESIKTVNNETTVLQLTMSLTMSLLMNNTI